METGRRKISNDLKRKIVMEVMSGELSKEAARRVYDIRGKSAVHDWIRLYGHEFGWIENPVIGLPPMSKEKDSDLVEQLKAKISKLEKDVVLAKDKAGLFETMIEIAEKRFNIDIKKKSAARPFITTKDKQKPQA
jgi:transposase-like protein